MLRRQGLSQLSFLENATFPRRTKGPLVFQRHDFDLNNVINFGCGSMMPQRRWAESIRRSAISTYKSRSFSHTASLYVDSAQNSSPPSGYTDDWDPGLMALSSNITEDTIPPLPLIMNDAIRKQVLTHRSVHARSTHVFEDAPGDPAPDNERLEHLGDAVLQLVITGLLQEYYPCLRVGPATKIRSLVVGNGTLAEISVKYKLPQMLALHQAQAITLRTSVHIRADVFEAYVGGLYMDQGLDVVKAWLCVLFQPFIHEAYRIVREQHGLPPPSEKPVYPTFLKDDPMGSPEGPGFLPSPSPSPAPPTIGYLSLFNQYIQQKRWVVEWVYSSERGPGTKTTPIWSVRVLLNGDNIAIGQGMTKKAAQNEAAKAGLDHLQVQVSESHGSPRA